MFCKQLSNENLILNMMNEGGSRLEPHAVSHRLINEQG